MMTREEGRRRRREMLDLARTGEYSDAELADIFGYKESSVAVYRSQERIAMGGPPKRDLIHERIREVIRENPDAGVTEIADLAQSYYGTVRRILDPEEYAVLLENSRRNGVERLRQRAPSPRISRAEMIMDLQRCAEEIGHSPSTRDFDNWSGVRRGQWYFRVFGSWVAALREAGLTPVRGRTRREYLTPFDTEVCVAALQECARDLGRPPGILTYDSWAAGRSEVPSNTTIRKYLGPWRVALAAAREQMVYSDVPEVAASRIAAPS